MLEGMWRGMTHRCLRSLALVSVLLAVLSGVAEARPTVSGILKAYNPGARRLQIQRDDGVVKNIVLSENASYEVYGNKVAPATFKLGMRVVVRISGSLGEDPLEADLLTDYGSSSRYVSRSAASPYSTPVGNYATGGGAGGVTPGLPSLGGPSVVGPLGMGGNFPGSLTNPGPTGPVQNSAYPAIPPMGPGTAGAQPSPLGSPWTGQVVAGQAPGQAPVTMSPTGGPAPLPVAGSPYGSPSLQGGPMSPAGLVDGGASPGGSSMAASMIGGSGEDDEEEGDSGPMPQAGGPLGMQVVQFQGRVLAADANNRTLTVVPAGAAYPIQVALPPSLLPVHSATGQVLPMEALRPGQGVVVHGLSNAAGIVEARQVQVVQ